MPCGETRTAELSSSSSAGTRTPAIARAELTGFFAGLRRQRNRWRFPKLAINFGLSQGGGARVTLGRSASGINRYVEQCRRRESGLHAAAKRILVVEDNELNMKLLNDVLEAHGYDVLSTGQGAVALEWAKQYHPDLILMDLQLPDISGLDVTRQLKADAATREIPVIAVTAFAMAGDEKKSARQWLRRLRREADRAARFSQPYCRLRGDAGRDGPALMRRFAAKPSERTAWWGEFPTG